MDENDKVLARYGNVEIVEAPGGYSARFDNFMNRQDSPWGCGKTHADAIAELARQLRRERHNALLDCVETVSFLRKISKMLADSRWVKGDSN